MSHTNTFATPEQSTTMPTTITTSTTTSTTSISITTSTSLPKATSAAEQTCSQFAAGIFLQDAKPTKSFAASADATAESCKSQQRSLALRSIALRSIPTSPSLPWIDLALTAR